jgi:hypothetical protein
MSGEQRRSDDEFVGQVRHALDAQSLAPELAERLTAVRRRAVASIDVPILRAPSSWVPVGALATTLLAVGIGVAIDNNDAPPLDDEQQIATVEDMDLLMDLEFVAWLDTDSVDAG